MPTHTPSSSNTKTLHDFFLARQPVLNRDQRLAAYDLMFYNAKSGSVQGSSDLSASATVIEHAAELGITQVTGDAIGFVNVDSTLLLSDIIKFLPANKFVLVLAPQLEITYEVVERLKDLATTGFSFAIDAKMFRSANIQTLLPLVKYIKLDTQSIPPEKLSTWVAQLKSLNKILLGQRIDNIESFNLCLQAGFDLYQGQYFSKPVVLAGKKIAPSYIAVMRLMELLMSDADSADIERSIKQNAALGINLLRMVNTPAAGFNHRIDSIRHALIVIGRRHLQRWLQILLYSANDKKQHLPSPLLMAATTRGKLLELLAEKLKPQNRTTADIAFTVGIMSHMDALFCVTMDDLLKQFAVADEVRDALLERKGFCGDLLRLVECLEQMEEKSADLMPVLNSLHLTVEDLYSLQLAAFEWTSEISSAAN